MAKRRLTEQQQRRIKQRQQQERTRLKEGGAAGEGEPTSHNGLVIAHYGSRVLIAEPPYDGQSTLRRCHARTSVRDIAAGDEVVWQQEARGNAVITAVQPRRTALQRPDSRQKLRTIAANIDVVLVVIAPLPEPHRNLLDRYLVVTENLRMSAVIVINKIDLADATDPSLGVLAKDYRRLGYEVLEVSARTGADLATLEERIAGHTCVLVGQSGVGKSSLLNRLVPNAEMTVGELSVGEAKGTHTTTASRLHFLPAGGRLIDSPGIREFGLGHLSVEDITHGMVEIRPLMGHCRFRNCRHKEEPDCAIKEGFESGMISPERMASFQYMTDAAETRTQTP